MKHVLKAQGVVARLFEAKALPSVLRGQVETYWLYELKLLRGRKPVEGAVVHEAVQIWKAPGGKWEAWTGNLVRGREKEAAREIARRRNLSRLERRKT